MHRLIITLVICVVPIIANSKTTQLEDLDFTDHSNESPKISRSSYFKQDSRLGYKLKLFCEASGTPRPRIVWYHRGVEVNPDHNRTTRPDEDILIPSKSPYFEAFGNPNSEATRLSSSDTSVIRFSIHGDTTSSHLEVDPTSIGDKGEYECVATNSKGSRVKKFLTDYQY